MTSKTSPISTVSSSGERGASRRGFIAGAAAAPAVAAAATMGFPSIAKGQVTWTMQAGWPTGDMLWEYAQDLVRIINDMSGGRLQINLLPAGAVVGALELQDAVVGGALDGSHGVTAYWYGKNKAASLFGTPPSFGWNAHEFMGWVWYGGGQELYDELVQDILGLDLAGFLYGPMPTQAFGWFAEPIGSVEQLTGLRYRTVGLAADLYEELGAAVTILGGPDIVPSLDRGVIDAAEFNNPSSDRALGFHDVAKNWMLRSYHQDCEVFEVNFNKDKYDELPDDLKAILRYATYAAHADMAWKAQYRYPRDQRWLVEEGGVTLWHTPEEILQAQLEAWDRVIERNSAENEFFARVIESQRAWAREAVGFNLVNETPKEPAYRHFFGEPPLPAREVG